MQNKVRNSIITALTVLTLVTVMSCGNPSEKSGGKKAKTDYSAPPISGMDINGKGSVSLTQLKGKVVILNFWATWCPPCRAEVPDLITLQEKYGQDLVILGVSVDKDGVDGVRKFTQEMGMNYPVIMGDSRMTASYGGIRSIPTSFIIDRKGDLVAKIVGGRSYQQFEDAILPYINQK